MITLILFSLGVSLVSNLIYFSLHNKFLSADKRLIQYNKKNVLVCFVIGFIICFIVVLIGIFVLKGLI